MTDGVLPCGQHCGGGDPWPQGGGGLVPDTPPPVAWRSYTHYPHSSLAPGHPFGTGGSAASSAASSAMSLAPAMASSS
jgi:hypothetical protein